MSNIQEKQGLNSEECMDSIQLNLIGMSCLQSDTL